MVFPPPAHAEPDGLLGVGGDLSVERLLLAYASGIFPWYDEALPILWYSPDPRAALVPRDLYLSRSLRRTLTRRRFEVRVDTSFEAVVRACAGQRRRGQQGTWITGALREAFIELHRLGYAHSVETFAGDELVGGLYGLSLGRAFFGESMFTLRPDASKVALAWLAAQVDAWGFDFIDCQVSNDHLRSLGARDWPRARFLECLADSLETPTRRGPWSFEAGLSPLGSVRGEERS